MTKAH